MERVGMLNILYHMCLYAYLKGEKAKASKYLDLLREEFRVKGSRNSFTTKQFKTIRCIRDAVTTGVLPGNQWAEEITIHSSKPAEGHQDDLVRRLHKECLNDIQVALGDKVELHNIEHPCDPYGRVDMLYMGSTTAYPVEVKRKTGEHDIVGQVLKYALALRFKLHYHHYDEVQPVTICAGYNPHTLKELKANGVLPLIYSGSTSTLKVSKV